MSWLTEYCDQRRKELQSPAPSLPSGKITEAPPRSFLDALKHPTRVAIIAEIKFRSPSMGMLRPQRDVEAVAKSYRDHGAAALSVLIDQPRFGGCLEDLSRAREASGLPVLAKGFLLHSRDVREARAAGADAVLLIADCLEASELRALQALTLDLGMTALIEVHSKADLDKIQGLDPALVGVNHRDLHSLNMDMDLTQRLIPHLPKGALKVAESGLSKAEDLRRMKALSYDAVLMGTRFMGDPNPGEALGKLLEALP